MRRGPSAPAAAEVTIPSSRNDPRHGSPHAPDTARSSRAEEPRGAAAQPDDAGSRDATTSPPAARTEPAVGTRLSAREIHDNVRHAAEEELERPAAALWWSSLAAGLAIGFSFVSAAFVTTLVSAEHATAAAAAAYPIGFIFVVLARNQLFTENTLEPVLPFLQRLTLGTLRRLLRLWAIVLIGNLVGALVFGLVLAQTPVLRPSVQHALLLFGEEGISGGFWLTVYRAIFAGWLIALLAWLVASTRFTGAQIVLIWLTTAPISAFGFKHSIAGSAEAFFVAASGAVTWGYAVGAFIVPAILGNIIGGVILVALLNHGQVAADVAAEAEAKRREWWSGYPGKG